MGYSYVDDGAAFVLGGKIKPDDLASGSRFGAAVAAGDGVLAIGAPGSPIGSVSAGLVSLYERVAGNLEVAASVTGASPGAGDGFGSSIAFDGDSLAVGAPGEQGDEGAAYLFGVSGANVNERFRATAPEATQGARFGTAVAVSAGRLAAGAPFEGGGAVYRFEADGALMLIDRLEAAGAQEGFGAALSASRDRLAVGAPSTDGERGAAILERDANVVFGNGFE